MKAKILCSVIGILIVFWACAVLAQYENQAMNLAKEAQTILDGAKSKDDYQRAAQKYEEALKILQRLKSDGPTGFCYNQLGVIQLSLGQYHKALDYLETSLAIRKKIGDVGGEGVTLSNIGEVYKTLGQYTKALDYYEQSLAIRKKIGDVSGEGTILAKTGAVYDRLSQYTKALDYYEQSLAISKKSGAVSREGTTLNNIGLVYHSLGQYTKALDYYEQSLTIRKKIGDVSGEGVVLGNIGLVYDSLGQYTKALDYYGQSLAISKKTGDEQGDSANFNNIGSVYINLGQYTEALDYFEQSLAISEKIGDATIENDNLNNIGAVYKMLGQYTKALDYYEQSLAISKKSGAVSREGNTLNNIGLVYDNLGQYTKALDYYGQSLAISKKIGDVKLEGINLANIGAAYAHMGKYDQASQTANESLAVQERIGVPNQQIKDSAANYYLDAGDMVKAEPLIKATGYNATLGRLALINSDYLSAKRYYENDMKWAEKTGDADALFRSYTGLGRAYEGMGDYSKAEEHYEKAVNQVEEIRSSLIPPERKNFFDLRDSGFRRTDPYDGLARVLIKMKKMPEALRTSEYTKARIFSESLGRWSENSGLEIPSEVLAGDRELNDRLAALKKKRREAYEKSNEELISAIEPQVKIVGERFQAHIKTLRDKYPLFAATKYPEPMDIDQSALKENEWVLEYHVTDTGILIYLTRGKEIVKALFKPLSKDELNRLIVRFRQPLEIVSKRDKFEEKLKSFDLATGKKLFDLLLGDVLALLPRGASVIIVPDDALGILPFEMLVMNDAGTIKADKVLPHVSGAEFFGDRNPISYCQSVTALTLTRIHSKRKPSDGGLLVLADPVFVENDKRTVKDTKTEPQSGVLASLYKSLMAGDESEQMGGLQFQRLSRTGELAEALAVMYKKNSAVYTGFAASKSNFLDNISPSLNKFNEVVFATHGYFGKDLPGIMEPVLVLRLFLPGLTVICVCRK